MLPARSEPKAPGPQWETYIHGSHNDTRDRIAAEFHSLPDFTCGFCEIRVAFPTACPFVVETEYTYSAQPRLRADVAALSRSRDVIALVEVILTSTPSDAALAAHEGVPFVAYVEMNQNAIYCSPFCWTHRGLANLTPWSVPRCEMCERPFHETISGTRWVDWRNLYGEVCLECAASIPNAQWRAPGEVIGGTKAPGPDATVAGGFLAFVDVEFWAMVWQGRAENPREPHGEPKDESATSQRLDSVEQALEAEDWDRGFDLLQPIGAPRWGAADCSKPLYAWQPENCTRVSAAWVRLREQRLGELPGVIASIIRCRGFRRERQA